MTNETTPVAVTAASEVIPVAVEATPEVVEAPAKVAKKTSKKVTPKKAPKKTETKPAPKSSKKVSKKTAEKTAPVKAKKASKKADKKATPKAKAETNGKADTSKDREAAKVAGIGLQHFRVLRSLVKVGEPLSYRQIADSDPHIIYNPLTKICRAGKEGSLAEMGLIREKMQDINGKDVLCFEATAKGKKLIETVKKSKSK